MRVFLRRLEAKLTDKKMAEPMTPEQDSLMRAEWRAKIEADMLETKAMLSATQATLAKTQEALQQNTEATMEIREAISALRFLNRVAKWLTPFIALLGALFGAWWQMKAKP